MPLVQALGFTRQPPCATTCHTVLHRIDRDVLAATLGAWAEALVVGTPAPPDTLEGIALDGQTLRGSQQQGAPGAPRLSALAHRVGFTLTQQAVADTSNEMPAAVELLRHGVLEGRGVPMDALLPQRQLAQQMVEAGGDYVRIVKENQPHLLEDIQTVFTHAPITGETRTAVATVDYGHGRIEQRG